MVNEDEITALFNDAGFRFLSKGDGVRRDGEKYQKVLYFRELETLEFIYVTVCEFRYDDEGWFEIGFSRLRKITGSLGVEPDGKVSRVFEGGYKRPGNVVEEVVEFADLIASYDSSG